SVASTAGPLIPVPRRGETRITPVPVATPLARPKIPEPSASPRVPRWVAFFLKTLRSGTGAMTAMPRVVATARAPRAPEGPGPSTGGRRAPRRARGGAGGAGGGRGRPRGAGR